MHAAQTANPRMFLIVRVPVTLRDGLRDLAQQEGETSSVLVRRLILQAIRDNKQRDDNVVR